MEPYRDSDSNQGATPPHGLGEITFASLLKTIALTAVLLAIAWLVPG
ncbi:MAG: hypothetical protein J0L75_06675 [Spirochaetes bacterium]|nr:hypothetical protein [Spirochaetota bacterium]